MKTKSIVKHTAFITKIDMGFMKPMKYAVWFPFPVYISKTGRQYHIHPNKRFKNEASATAYMQETIKGGNND